MSYNSGGRQGDRAALHAARSAESLAAAAGRQRLASPPYEARGSDGLPHYASRSDIGASSSPHSSQDSSRERAADDTAAMAKLDAYGYPAEKKLKEHAQEADGLRSVRDPSTSAPTQQLPRIAVTDPLHDMRAHGLSRPEVGLSEKSDVPHTGMQTPYDSRPGLSRRGSEASINTQSEFGYDDFDWSDDEGVEETLRTEKAEEKAARKKRSRRLSPYSIGRWLFVSFLGNFLISAILVVPAIVIQFVYRNEATDANRVRRDYVADNVQAWTIWASFNLFASWVFHILVELFPRLCLGLVALVWGRTNQTALNAAEYYSAQKGYIKPLFYAACSWASFAIIFNSIFGLYNHSDPKNGRAAYLYRIYQVIEFLFFVTLTICVEKIIIKNIALSFHQSAFAERIAEVAKSLDTFDHLKDYRPKFKDGSRAFGRPKHLGGRSTTGLPTPAGASPAVDLDEDKPGSGASSPRGYFDKKKHSNKRPQQNPDAILADSMGSGATSPAVQYPPKSGAAHPRQALKKVNEARDNAVRSLKLTASSASKLARIAMKDPLAVLQSEKAGGIADINSPAEAKKLAKTIFTAFRGRHHRPYLVLSDFEPAFTTQAQAKEAFAVFDKDGNGDISQTEIKNQVLTVYKERRHLMKAIGDTNHAVAQLDSIFLVVAFVIIMFEAFAIFNVDVSKTLTTFYTLGIAFAFIFKESAQNVFDSIVFIFVTHPMDTGDRIQLGDAVMVVKKMSLLSSEFTLADGTDMYVANAVLASMLIQNFRRSGYQWENFLVQVDFNTTLEQLDAVERDLCHWLQTEPERLFEPSTALVPQHISYMRYIEISIGMTHRANWQDWGARFVRKNAFGAALTYYMQKHNIRYYQPTQPIFQWEGPHRSPPTYDDVAGGVRDADAYHLDDFEPAEGPAGSGLPGSSSLAPKRPNYMGFTPPSDELGDESATRQRKTRQKGLTVQGGDG